MKPNERLEALLAKAARKLTRRDTVDPENSKCLEYICRHIGNRAPVRLLIACMLAKLDNIRIDPRKPYTAIGGDDCFSGRSYDEKYVTSFVAIHRFPCNSTTAFLTPGFRNFNRTLSTDVTPVGQPKLLYEKLFLLLEAVATGQESATNILTDAFRILLEMRNVRIEQLESLQASLKQKSGPIALSTEMIISLVQQHLACRGSSRLPVLLIAAAYDAVGDRIGETRRPLHSHNAADEQTGAFGDVEILVANEEQVRTVYEMKHKRVTIDDIDRAIQKIARVDEKIDNYLFVTTDEIDRPVAEYASQQYAKMGSTEIAIVDCIGFLRHFLHFFHRKRIDFLNAYQSLVLADPDSSVSVPLKTALLSLRLAAESEA